MDYFNLLVRGNGWFCVFNLQNMEAFTVEFSNWVCFYASLSWKMQVFFALTMMSVGVLESISLSRDFIKVQDAVVSCFRIIDMISKIDVSSEVGRTLDTVEGSTDYRAAAQELQVPSLDQRANLRRFVFEDTISQGTFGYLRNMSCNCYCIWDSAKYYNF